MISRLHVQSWLGLFNLWTKRHVCMYDIIKIQRIDLRTFYVGMDLPGLDAVNIDSIQHLLRQVRFLRGMLLCEQTGKYKIKKNHN